MIIKPAFCGSVAVLRLRSGYADRFEKQKERKLLLRKSYGHNNNEDRSR